MVSDHLLILSVIEYSLDSKFWHFIRPFSICSIISITFRSFRIPIDHFDYRSITIQSYKAYWLFWLQFDYHSSDNRRAEIFSFVQRKNVALCCAWEPPAHWKSPVFSGAAKKTPFFTHRKLEVSLTWTKFFGPFSSKGLLSNLMTLLLYSDIVKFNYPNGFYSCINCASHSVPFQQNLMYCTRLYDIFDV